MEILVFLLIRTASLISLYLDINIDLNLTSSLIQRQSQCLIITIQPGHEI